MGEALSVLFGLIAVIVIVYVATIKNEETNPEKYSKKKLFKNIDKYRVSLPISLEDPFKSTKYTSQQILKAKSDIEEIKKYWIKEQDKLREMSFMSTELYLSIEEELLTLEETGKAFLEKLKAAPFNNDKVGQSFIKKTSSKPKTVKDTSNLKPGSTFYELFKDVPFNNDLDGKSFIRKASKKEDPSKK